MITNVLSPSAREISHLFLFCRPLPVSLFLIRFTAIQRCCATRLGRGRIGFVQIFKRQNTYFCVDMKCCFYHLKSGCVGKSEPWQPWSRFRFGVNDAPDGFDQRDRLCPSHSKKILKNEYLLRDLRIV